MKWSSLGRVIVILVTICNLQIRHLGSSCAMAAVRAEFMMLPDVRNFTYKEKRAPGGETLFSPDFFSTPKKLAKLLRLARLS